MCKNGLGKVFVCSFLLYLSGCKTVSSKQPVNHFSDDLKNVVQEDLKKNKELSKENSGILLDLNKALRPNGAEKKLPIKESSSLEKKFNISADQVDARAFFLGLVADTSYNMVVHPNVTGKLSLQLNNVSIKEVLDTVRNVYGYDYRQNGNNIELLPATLQSRTFTVSYLDLERGGRSETQVVSGGINSNNANSTSSGTSNNTSNNANNTNNSNNSGSNNSSETVNSRITTVSKTNYWIELKKAIETIIGNGEGRKVAVSPLAGVVVVHAMPDELYQVEKFLGSSQSSLNRQVILEAKILEVTLNKDHQSGINWSLLADRNRIQLSHLGSGVITDDALSADLPTTGISNGLQLNNGSLSRSSSIGVSTIGSPFGMTMNFKNFSSFIELLESQGNVQVLSSPRVSTTNNQKALIKVGKDEFFVTNVSSTNVVGATTTNSSPNVSFQPFFSGIALDVTPHISPEGDVTLHIHPSITSVSQKDMEVDLLSGSGSGSVQKQKFPLATSSVRESDSIVRAKNGQVVVIGGLMQDQVGDSVVGLPLLKDLPLFGRLFKHTRKTSKKSELVILLRPYIVDDERWNKALKDELTRLDTMQEKQ